MFNSRVCLYVVGVLAMFLARDAMALREGAFGNDPVKDQNWRTGAVDVANLKTRIAFWHGPTSECEFLYQGNTEAFAEALRLFGQVRAPELNLYLHDGPQQHWSQSPSRDARVDWTFLIHDAQEYYRWNNAVSANPDRSPRFREPLPAPRLNVYIGGGGIEWDKVRVPAGVHVIDERVSATGLKPEGGPIIRGSIYDQATSKILPGATITIVRPEKDNTTVTVATAQSDAQGKFQIEKIPAGTYQVHVTADKFAARFAEYAIVNGRDVKTYAIDLAPAQTVSGQLLDSAGRPVAAAEVKVYTSMGMDGRGYSALTSPATTDAQGRFTIAGLPRGYCTFTFTAKDLRPILSDKPFNTSAKDIVVRAGSSGAIKGRVVGADGAALRNSSVRINIQDAVGMKVGTWGGNIPVKEDGTFSFDNVPIGNYVIAPKPIFLPGEPLPPEAKTITVEAGKTVQVQFEVK